MSIDEAHIVRVFLDGVVRNVAGRTKKQHIGTYAVHILETGNADVASCSLAERTVDIAAVETHAAKL